MCLVIRFVRDRYARAKRQEVVSAASCHPLSRRSCVECRSVTITDEFMIASGYGSVMVLVNGLEPLPIRLQGDCSTIGAKPAYLAGQRGLEPR